MLPTMTSSFSSVYDMAAALAPDYPSDYVVPFYAVPFYTTPFYCAPPPPLFAPPTSTLFPASSFYAPSSVYAPDTNRSSGNSSRAGTAPTTTPEAAAARAMGGDIITTAAAGSTVVGGGVSAAHPYCYDNGFYDPVDGVYDGAPYLFPPYDTSVRITAEMREWSDAHPDCINASNPYHECVYYCLERIAMARRAALCGNEDNGTQSLLAPSSTMPEKVPAAAVQEIGSLELEGLEEEARKQREARELRKSKKSMSSSPSAEEDDIELAEDKLVLKLLEYERLGYLTKVDNEEDDESLIHYGDKFGIAVLNEYPFFFIRVPQHPHYRETSLDKVVKGDAENCWDLFMPLMKRGLSAIRDNKVKEIVAVERVIARLTEYGFDFKHLQAYINISRRAHAIQGYVKDELVKVESKIEIEKQIIDDVISSKPLVEIIEELEADKAKYQKLIEDIEASLAQKIGLLDKEKAIRASGSTPEHDNLLDFKARLERSMQAVNGKLETLFLHETP